eukprot:CAMPEP_0202892576 /NCGR_PEP_ID=MMETSP1392-20130828/2288_1 /ASSEMBLY_ACC=CAM_ASM_000868 /TAXON_ID=225041 /ORGANISM="Chlamydomonas chlamydogama, Strain SAG 11-48b" /LENGTH=378 /DNA_ID=CAMNT_0049576583 /DNA_START=285 /DNA_END=1421 /DNA_ORIENTATION=-
MAAAPIQPSPAILLPPMQVGPSAAHWTEHLENQTRDGTATAEELMAYRRAEVRPSLHYVLKLARWIMAVQHNATRVLFHHLHKAAGTTMCHKVIQARHRVLACDGSQAIIADDFGSISPAADCNCNGHMERYGPFSTLHRQQQMQYLKSHADASVFFSESPLGEDMYYGVQLFHLTVVRHPFSRFLSHMMHFLGLNDPPQYQTALLNINHAVQLHSINASSYDEIRDNYITRFFAGLHVTTSVPFMDVNETHLVTAALNLKRFGAIFLLEDLVAADGLFSALLRVQRTHQYRAGTNTSQIEAQHPDPGMPTGSYTSSQGESIYNSLSPESIAYLQKVHKYDLVLYEYCKMQHARVLAAWDMLTFLQVTKNAAGHGDKE